MVFLLFNDASSSLAMQAQELQGRPRHSSTRIRRLAYSACPSLSVEDEADLVASTTDLLKASKTAGQAPDAVDC
jgi:hypothetical protein